ncbi:aminoacyl-histidine dipeptidase [Gallibacterium anatis]|uniref:aminoacyl-histidine dipeptidase n=1 Tax=Gallibacterium anatis TaxID=750 RepID=UPI000531FF36|nr:aminoacyl-histidine dipeptidase [Gallibacterium anatis]KGQ45353.1 aminoacyl-histidine dipeptidase [Gallibacterium anatis]KGQ52242.1 aminoacyl-histidine dipeptidase [Gallibacterium anatis]KGQ58807.1 aminoacyl-histidine dipeptidase [Gallibacterium anatis]
MSSITELSPNLLWQWFAKICSIPHPSHHEQALADFIIQWAKQKQLWVEQDAAGNILIRKAATAGMEDHQPVALQAHLDMVPQANKNTAHNFLTDPIVPYVEGEWVKATGTTLGADNGIGMASCLAVLDSNDIAHPPLEVLLTASEETGMVGALGLQPNWLQSEVMINTDTEDEGEIYIGCAGGEDVDIRFPVQWQALRKDEVAVHIALTGLKGGHSGAEIHLNRGNAIKLLAKTLEKALAKVSFRLADISGGSVRNAIPREAFATVLLSSASVEKFKQVWQLLSQQLIEALSHAEKQINFALEEATAEQGLSERQSQILLDLINALPNGVIRFSDVLPDVVETSISLGVLETKAEQIKLTLLARSLNDHGQDDVVSLVRSVCRLADAEVVFSGRYPGWEPQADANIVKRTKTLYDRILGKESVIKVIHAGLECGLINKVYPNMEMVSIGPTILGAHSPDERCHIPAVAVYWQLLTELLATMPKK